MLLRNDADECISHAYSIFDNFDNMPTAAQHVIVSMIFNLGSQGFRGFKQTIAYLRGGAWVSAAHELMDSKAARDLPERYGRYRDSLLSLAE